MLEAPFTIQAQGTGLTYKDITFTIPVGSWAIIDNKGHIIGDGKQPIALPLEHARQVATALNTAHGIGYAKRGADIREALGV